MGDYLQQGYTELIIHPAQVVVTRHKLVSQYWNLSQHHALVGHYSFVALVSLLNLPEKAVRTCLSGRITEQS